MFGSNSGEMARPERKWVLSTYRKKVQRLRGSQLTKGYHAPSVGLGTVELLHHSAWNS